ncbi:MAG: NAD(P)-dependent oxidoreductase [Betaproteobacteria bacterium]|nr:NAD(P)-dependent oxidoreductase [Betaproteobacteria bacterium]
MHVALIGIGLMGLPMAKRLCEAGLQPHLWNRTRAKAEPLAALGARVHDTVAQAVRDADIVVTMLEDGDVVESVLFEQGLAQALQPGSLLIDMSSIQPAQARSHGQRLAALGVGYLDAPVSGGTLGAEAGNLAIMAGGTEEAFERARAVLTHFGRPTLVGPTGSGQLAKLANQMIVGVTIGVVAEALLLCAKGGADMAKVKEAVTGGFADSRILQVHGQRMIERDFAPRGRISVQLKDMRNAMATAQELGFDAPITGLLETLYASAGENGLSGMDQAAFFAELARRNGMA